MVLRKEFDDWAVLFDPDTGKAFGLNPVGVVIWELLDGEHALADITTEVRTSFEDAPESVDMDVVAFVQSLVELGMAGVEAN